MEKRRYYPGQAVDDAIRAGHGPGTTLRIAMDEGYTPGDVVREATRAGRGPGFVVEQARKNGDVPGRLAADYMAGRRDGRPN